MVVWWLVLVGGYSPAWLMWDYHLSPDNRNSYETNRLYSCCLIVSYVVCTYIYLSNLSIYLSIHPSIYPSIHRSIYLSIYLSMRVSINGGTPKWLVYDGKSYQNRWFGDPPISGNSTYIYICNGHTALLLCHLNNMKSYWNQFWEGRWRDWTAVLWGANGLRPKQLLL